MNHTVKVLYIVSSTASKAEEDLAYAAARAEIERTVFGQLDPWNCHAVIIKLLRRHDIVKSDGTTTWREVGYSCDFRTVDDTEEVCVTSVRDGMEDEWIN